MSTFEITASLTVRGRFWIEAKTPEAAKQKLETLTKSGLIARTTSRHMAEELISLTIDSFEEQKDYT